MAKRRHPAGHPLDVLLVLAGMLFLTRAQDSPAVCDGYWLTTKIDSQSVGVISVQVAPNSCRFALIPGTSYPNRYLVRINGTFEPTDRPGQYGMTTYYPSIPNTSQWSGSVTGDNGMMMTLINVPIVSFWTRKIQSPAAAGLPSLTGKYNGSDNSTVTCIRSIRETTLYMCEIFVDGMENDMFLQQQQPDSLVWDAYTLEGTVQTVTLSSDGKTMTWSGSGMQDVTLTRTLLNQQEEVVVTRPAPPSPSKCG